MVCTGLNLRISKVHLMYADYVLKNRNLLKTLNGFHYSSNEAIPSITISTMCDHRVNQKVLSGRT